LVLGRGKKIVISQQRRIRERSLSPPYPEGGSVKEYNKNPWGVWRLERGRFQEKSPIWTVGLTILHGYDWGHVDVNINVWKKGQEGQQIDGRGVNNRYTVIRDGSESQCPRKLKRERAGTTRINGKEKRGRIKKQMTSWEKTV